MQTVRFAVGGLLLAFVASTLIASDSSFQLQTTSPNQYTAAYLGNGALGLTTTVLGTDAAKFFLAEVYDHTAGDVPRVAAAPSWNEVDVSNGSHWLNGVTAYSQLSSYRQVLDMYDGSLRTEYTWTADGRSVHLLIEAFVSRDNAETAAVRVAVTPQFAGPMQIRLPLRNWPAPRRYALERIEKLDDEAARNPWAIWYPGRLVIRNLSSEDKAHGAVLSLLAQAPGYGEEIGEAVAVEWPSHAVSAIRKAAEGISADVTVQATAGSTYTFTKFAAVATVSEKNAKTAATAIEQRGWQHSFSLHAEAWHKLWQADILVDGNPAVQRTVHSMLFYLLGSCREGLRVSTAPMGLSSAGYYGHLFWDADTYLFPALVLLHPELARPMVEFRSRTREAARANAKRNGYAGAMYPWEAGPDGAESTPRFAGQNAKYENHVNGDVALAAWQYWQATGDREWLTKECWPILRDTADFWVSRVNYNNKFGRYEIGHVVSVNESLIGVTNDAYTNAVAKKNLELALTAAKEVGAAPGPKWREIASKLYQPESDSVLLWFPLQLPFTQGQTRRAANEMAGRVRQGKTGAMMGTEFYPVLATELSDCALTGKIFYRLWKPYLRPPYQVVAETPENQNTNFITGAGAFLQQMEYIYTGLRLEGNGLERKFAPVLPPDIQRVTLQKISVHGKVQSLVFGTAPGASGR